MITKPTSQLFIYDKTTCNARPCGQNVPVTTGSSAGLSEMMQIFHPLSEVCARRLPHKIMKGSSMVFAGFVLETRRFSSRERRGNRHAREFFVSFVQNTFLRNRCLQEFFTRFQ